MNLEEKKDAQENRCQRLGIDRLALPQIRLEGSNVLAANQN